MKRIEKKYNEFRQKYYKSLVKKNNNEREHYITSLQNYLNKQKELSEIKKEKAFNRYQSFVSDIYLYINIIYSYFLFIIVFYNEINK